MNNDSQKPNDLQVGQLIKVIEQEGSSIIKGFELGSYQDREPQQQRTPQASQSQQSSAPKPNDTNTSTPNK